jgi:hypothetical protein
MVCSSSLAVAKDWGTTLLLLLACLGAGAVPLTGRDLVTLAVAPAANTCSGWRVVLLLLLLLEAALDVTRSATM